MHHSLISINSGEKRVKERATAATRQRRSKWASKHRRRHACYSLAIGDAPHIISSLTSSSLCMPKLSSIYHRPEANIAIAHGSRVTRPH